MGQEKMASLKTNSVKYGSWSGTMCAHVEPWLPRALFFGTHETSRKLRNEQKKSEHFFLLNMRLQELLGSSVISLDLKDAKINANIMK